MGDDRVRLVVLVVGPHLDPQLLFRPYADHAHVQIYSLERYMIEPTIISEQTRYSFAEIFVNFIKRRPTFDLEIVFKDDAGVKHKSNKFKKDVLVHWDLDMFVYFAASSSLETDRFPTVTLELTAVLH